MQVKWRQGFEPYVVLPSRKIQQYEVTLLDRMGDKTAFAQELSAKRYIP